MNFPCCCLLNFVHQYKLDNHLRIFQGTKLLFSNRALDCDRFIKLLSPATDSGGLKVVYFARHPVENSDNGVIVLSLRTNFLSSNIFLIY